MDQDAFRQLLIAGREGSAQRTTAARSSFRWPSSKLILPSKQSTDSPKTELKPRKVKNVGSNYRDRAAERRESKLDEATKEIEAVTETIESPRTSGDDKPPLHEEIGVLNQPPLVKGLDFALLEKFKSRAANTADEEGDELLEKAFLGMDASLVEAEEQIQDVKKRTRADLVRELKEKRATENTPNGLEKPLDEAKREGKFKPIGFKPIGGSSSTTNDTKEKETVRKKKKRKLESGTAKDTAMSAKLSEALNTPKDAMKTAGPSKPDLKAAKIIEPEPYEEIVDIFAGAGEYEGFNFDEEEEEGGRREFRKRQAEAREGYELSPSHESARRQKWIEDDEQPFLPSRQTSVPPDDKGNHKEKSEQPPEVSVSAEPEPEVPQRLMPLASSYVPSIRDILDADLAIEADKKRKARKEKRKAGAGDEKKKVSAETKLNREYQKFKAYTDKKGDS